MLPVYDAIKVEKIIAEGGSTRPWLIEVLVKDKPETYVVKLFTTKHINQVSAVANEVYANAMAKELGLKCPNAALINFPEHFDLTLTEEQQKELSLKDSRIKFGSVYIEGATTFSPNVKFEHYELESVYAFDMLIVNWDRRIQKPNILVKNQDLFLIDHELSFQYSEEHINSFHKGVIINKYFDHLFYNILKSEKDSIKKHYFNEFGYYLKDLKVEKLESYMNQLYRYNHPIGQYQLIKKYLNLLKQYSHKFEEILRNTLL